ncbi:MAG: AlpA family transcriptional regulator [Saezia sp.]
MSSFNNSPHEQRRILRRAEVEKRTGYKRAYIYRLIKEGKFPRQFKIGERAVGWDSFEIDQWVNERLGGTAAA